MRIGRDEEAVHVSYHEFLGIPFKFLGRDHSGVDCLGLIWLYLRSRGYAIPDSDGLPMLEDKQEDYPARAMEALRKIGTEVEFPQADDVVLMNLPGGYTHLGVMVDEWRMLHVLKDRPSALELVTKYRRRIAGVFRPNPELRRR